MQIQNRKREYLNKTKQEFYQEIKKYQKELKPTKEIDGFATSAILGEKNYPNISAHSISNENKDSSFFNTSKIVKSDYENIIKLNAKNLLGTTQNTFIRKTDENIYEELRDIYKSKKEVNFTSNFENELKFNKVLTHKVYGIMGSKNPLTKIKTNENTKTDEKIEKFTASDIKAKEAMITLYEKGKNEHQIINLLALGSFGINLNRKLVPTKWAISAFDQTIEKHLHKKIINYKQTNSYEVFHHKDKGNEFIIVIIPHTFSAEIIETFPGAIEKDFVNFNNVLNKKEPETAGGFYATKFPIHEYLNQNQKQSSYISIRIIKDYELPLGVVFVRESLREALKNKIFKTTNQKDLHQFLLEKYPVHYKFFRTSKVLEEIKKQKTLTGFF